MSDSAFFGDSIQNYDMPSRKAILQYLVRMGSFTSAPKIPNEDEADEDITFSSSFNWKDLNLRCDVELNGWPSRIQRNFVEIKQHGSDRIRIMQWNILAQALAEKVDGFVMCPPEALEWQSRRWKLLSEMTAMRPDILCLQEVDHFRFLQRAFSRIGFTGVFCPKPDSPCIYIPGNNGPDGCALFINTHRFDILDTRTRCLEVWGGVQTNQVIIFCKLRRRSDEAEFWVATTHLKARSGSIMASMRRQQGCDILRLIKETAGERTPFLLAGDLNADPSEPVHSDLRNAGFESVYHSQVPYTTWVIREDGEHRKTLDYILYRQGSFLIERVLRLPEEEDIGKERVPSVRYPSDHFALVADLVLNTT